MDRLFTAKGRSFFHISESINPRTMSYKKTPFRLLLFISLFMACSGSKEQASEEPEDGKESEERTEAGTDKETEKSKEKEMEAKVKDFGHLDGCRYLLIGPEEKKYHPLNMDTAYFEDGLEVEVRYRKKDAITTCMAGTTIHILDIKARD